MSKQYGLILPNKKATGSVSVRKPAIFDDDSDSDTSAPPIPTGQQKATKQDELDQQKALEEDPTVYQYDEIYDQIENKKKETLLAKKDVDKKPKYINRLLAAADRRKRENERRIERQVQIEREAEGDEFKDKESFVTSAYKKKLEELKELEEQEKREDYLEAIGDVTKQGNLDGFYRHLYDQKVNFEDKLKEEKEIKSEPESDQSGNERETRKRRSNNSGGEEDNKIIKRKPDSKKRKYRSRQDTVTDDENDEPQTENIEVKKEHLPSNLDADSDFSMDSTSSDEEEDKKDDAKTKTTDDKIEHEGEKLQLPAKGNVLSDNAALAKEPEVEAGVQEHQEEKEKKEENPKKPKVDIWKKRTVGNVFDDAVKRYFERKSARGW